jgi:hypothetical protein
MFEPFSRGYYLGRLYVRPRESDRAVMQADQHDEVERQVYGEDGGGEQPLVMKLDERHLAVHGAPDVPADTLAVPPSVLADTRIRNPPALRGVLLAKAETATQMLSLFGDESGAGPNPA